MTRPTVRARKTQLLSATRRQQTPTVGVRTRPVRAPRLPEGFDWRSFFDDRQRPPLHPKEQKDEANVGLGTGPWGSGHGVPEEDNSVPSEATHGSVPADEDERTRELALAQEQAVLISRGVPVGFTNANGQTEALRFEQVDGGWTVTDADGNSFTVLSTEGLTSYELLQGVAAFADYWTQYPAHLRDSVSVIELYPGELRANYSQRDGGVLKMGMDDLDEKTFDHEFGHGVGALARLDSESPFARMKRPGYPTGWQDAIEADGVAPSEYANRNAKEDFAESWLMYVEAREEGPEAVEALREAYPNRMAIIEAIYDGTWGVGTRPRGG